MAGGGATSPGPASGSLPHTWLLPWAPRPRLFVKIDPGLGDGLDVGVSRESKLKNEDFGFGLIHWESGDAIS